MNTENKIEEKSTTTIGQQLKHAREQMGLDAKDVAEQLCLKKSMINDIENDRCPPEVALTFFRGYVRSYAKLVNLPEEQLLPLPHNLQKNRHEFKPATLKGSALTKSSRKRDSWIMPLTWLILIIVLGLTGVWWWQNHNLEKEKINDLANTNDHLATLPNNNNGMVTLNVNNSTQKQPVSNLVPTTPTVSPANVLLNNDNTPGLLTVSTLLQQKLPAPPILKTELTEEAKKQQEILFNTVYMSFTKDCWVVVIDADKMRLVNGLQRKGSTLKLSGKPPYQVRLGLPSAAEITFRGQSIDTINTKGSVLIIGS